MDNSLQVELRQAGYEGDFTLEALIEVCGGQKNFRLQSYADGKWFAYSFLPAKGGDGTTPSEAVARLYLALHKT
jgi:hypothetical protein